MGGMKAGAPGSCGPRVGPERPARRAGQIVQRKLGSLRGGILSEWKGSPLAGCPKNNSGRDGVACSASLVSSPRIAYPLKVPSAPSRSFHRSSSSRATRLVGAGGWLRKAGRKQWEQVQNEPCPSGASRTPPPTEGLRAVGCGHPSLRRGNGAGIGVRAGDPSVSLLATAPAAVPKILCSLNAHRILTAATRSPRCLCPRQRSTRSPFAQGSLAPRGAGDGGAGDMGDGFGEMGAKRPAPVARAF